MDLDTLGTVALVAVFLCFFWFVYLLPTQIAFRRRLWWWPLMLVLNLLGGWTLLGWIALLLCANSGYSKMDADSRPVGWYKPAGSDRWQWIGPPEPGEATIHYGESRRDRLASEQHLESSYRAI